MITVYTVAFNEELQLQFFIDFYRSRFKDCHIVIYDNMSTDDTVKIGKENNCEIISYDTNNQINDKKYLEIKNNCWKSSQTDWVLVADVDELLDITPTYLLNEYASIISSEGYNMINMDNCPLSEIKWGARHYNSDKSYLFNKREIKEINYEAGCHKANPTGNVSYSERTYRAYHYNFINLELSIEKYKTYAKRLSPENIKNGWGIHYLMTPEQIKAEYLEIQRNAIRLFL
jgi:hypothetical protein